MRISDWSSDVCSSDLVPGKALALLLWLPLLWPSRGLPGQGEAELVVLDVGQGLSVLVRTARHGLLYDMGPAQPDGFDAGERVGVPSLRADRKSVVWGTSVSVRVDLGGRRNLKKNNKKEQHQNVLQN